jgi:hypothetical protein
MHCKPGGLVQHHEMRVCVENGNVHEVHRLTGNGRQRKPGE